MFSHETHRHLQRGRASRRLALVLVALFASSATACSNDGEDSSTGVLPADVVLQRSDVPAEYEATRDKPGAGLNAVAENCLSRVPSSDSAASDNFTRGQELVYTWAEMYPTSTEAESALAITSTPAFHECLVAFDATATGNEPGPPLPGWTVTRYLFEPVLANTTFSYFDLAVAQKGSFLVFMLDRKRGDEFPTELRRELAAAMLSRIPG